MRILVNKTHTMTVGRSKNKISRMVGITLSPEEITCFDVIEKTSVSIISTETIDNMKEVNKNYVTP